MHTISSFNSIEKRAAKCAHVVAAIALVSTLGACRLERGLSRAPAGAPPVEEPHLEARKKTDPSTGRVLHEWSVLVSRNRPPVKHGRETVWSARGEKLWEREYANGKPQGVWRSFYSDGTPKTESFFGDANVETQMSFWYPNGKLRMQGPARNGVRSGHWRIWYDDGSLAEEGEFVGNFREGEWRSRSRDGSACSVQVYKRNVRTDNRSVPCDDAPAPSTPGS